VFNEATSEGISFAFNEATSEGISFVFSYPYSWNFNDCSQSVLKKTAGTVDIYLLRHVLLKIRRTYFD
jgi:hypothetical protein